MQSKVRQFSVQSWRQELVQRFLSRVTTQLKTESDHFHSYLIPLIIFNCYYKLCHEPVKIESQHFHSYLIIIITFNLRALSLFLVWLQCQLLLTSISVLNIGNSRSSPLQFRILQISSNCDWTGFWLNNCSSKIINRFVKTFLVEKELKNDISL